jgi:hypothetical protein
MSTQEHEKDGLESPGEEKAMPALATVLSAQPSQSQSNVSKLPRVCDHHPWALVNKSRRADQTNVFPSALQWKLYIMCAGLTVMTAANSAAIQSMVSFFGFWSWGSGHH